MFQIVNENSAVENLPLVGCEEHLQDLTKKIINFYIVMRGAFLSYSTNKLLGYKNKK